MSTTTTAPGEIRPGERRELKALVKQRIKLLRQQVDQEHANRLAQVDSAVAAKFTDTDERLKELNDQLQVFVRNANRRLAQIFNQYGDVVDTHHRGSVSAPYYHQKDNGRAEARRALQAQAHAERERAHTRLTELELELIESLTVDGLKSEAALAFLKSMPTVEAVLASVHKPAEIGAGSRGE